MKKQTRPLVSVIMPVYNAERYLRAAIESILTQTYRNFELILINDASTDKTAQIIAEYKKQNSRKIRVITLTANLNGGGDRCANLGIKIARGEFIARMDADDIAHPERLARQVEFLQENPKITIVGSNAYVINKRGKVIGEKLEPTSPHAIYNSYFTFHPMIHPTCMIRAVIPPVERVKQAKPFAYDIEYSANNDYNTFFKLLCQGHRFANLEEKLLYYRIHGKNDTFVHVKKKFANTLRIRLTMMMQYGYTPSVHGLAMTAIQGAMMLFPERALIYFYLVAKGIKKPSNPLQKFKLAYKSRVATLFAHQ